MVVAQSSIKVAILASVAVLLVSASPMAADVKNQDVPAWYAPTTLPCTSTLALTLPPGKESSDKLKVKVLSREIVAPPTVHGVLTITISPDSDCGQTLTITDGAVTQSFQIAAQVQPGAGDLEKELRVAKDDLVAAVALPNLVRYTIFAAALASLLSLAFVVLIWLKQRATPEDMSISQASLNTLVKALVPVVGKPKPVSGKAPGLAEGEPGKITKALDEITWTTEEILRLVQPPLDKARFAPIAVPDSPLVAQRPSSSAETYYPEPQSTRVPLRSISFEEAYNAAIGSRDLELRYPGLVRIISVTPRERPGGDKTQAGADPLVTDDSGVLRLFILKELADDEAYLAPALEMWANGITNTHTRKWKGLFRFPNAPVTRLDQAAVMRRTSEGYEIETPGELS